MKGIKKLLTGILAASMALSITMTAGTAMTAKAATITVENNDPDDNPNTPQNEKDQNSDTEVYKAYKIFDAVKAEGASVTTNGTKQTLEGGISYKISKNSDWFSVLFKDDGSAQTGNVWFTATAISGEEYQVIPTDETKGLTDAKVIADWLFANGKKDSDGKLTGGKSLTVGTANTVDDGYYLVTSSLGATLGLATTDIPMTIVEKNTYPTIDKKQNDEGVDKEYKDAVVNVGVNDTIWYSVDVDVPATAKGELYVTDTMSEGLTYNETAGLAWSISEGSITKDDYTIITERKTGETWTWKAAIKANERTLGKKVTIKYSATVNKNAIVDDETKQNEVKLDYSNFTQKDYVQYVDHATGAVKYDGATAEVQNGALVVKAGSNEIKYLKDAEFKLQVNSTDVPVVKVGDYYRPAVEGEKGVVITSDDNGQIMIRGLDKEKGYTLVETKAPAGYNLLTTPVELIVTLDAKKNVAITAGTDENTTYLDAANIAKIENLQGSILPSTGGIGTTIFYIVGGLLIVAAVVFFVVRRRADAE